MKYRPSRIVRWIALLAGCLCITVGGYGLIHSVKASLSYKTYKRIKYGHFTKTAFEIAPECMPTNILPACERIMNLYPHNYYAAVLAANAALDYALEDHESSIKERWIRTAQYWDDMGMRLNPYNVEVYSAHARVLQETGKSLEASRFWRETILEREFWNPDRHDTMAQIYLRAGQLDRAVEELPWVRDHDTYSRILAHQQQYEAILKMRNRKK